MIVSVYFDNEFQGKVSFHSLVSLSMFCEQQGLNVILNKKEERVDITSRYKSEPISISTLSNSLLGHKVLNNLQNFLSSEGISIVKNEEQNKSIPKILVYIEDFETMTEAVPLIIIDYQLSIDERFINILLTELHKAKIHYQFEEQKNNYNTNDYHFYLKCTQNKEEINYFEFSMILARAIIRHYNNKQQNNSLPFIPKSIFKNWLKIFMNSEIQTDQKKEQTLENPVGFSLQKRKFEQEAKAEIFFNYTLIPPRFSDKHNEFLINATLFMKNTGNVELINPIICIKVPQQQNIQLQGQILPPKMVPSLAIMGADGKKGWKYVYDDWREKIKSNGEYWISPIQEFHIPPGESASLSEFKFVINEAKENSSCVIQAFVYFNERKHKYSSNNFISISF